MRWSERIKLTFETFKRVALPIYGWYFIFAFVGLGILMAGLLPFIIPMLNMRGSSYSSPFPNPNPPMPPGSSYSGLSPFGDILAPYLSSPYLSQIPYFILIVIVILLLSWIGSSAFMAGLFNLTQKGLHENVRFRDFRFSGTPRVFGWYGILTLVSFLVIIAGIVGAFAFRGVSSYILPLFGSLYVLLMVSLGIFLMPWLSTSVFYILNHRKLSFGRSLSGSWDFYRRNMGSLWILIITIIGIQILLSIIYKVSSSLYFIAALLAGPFTAILPIVWVLSLEEETDRQNLTWASSETSSEPSASDSSQSFSSKSADDPSSYAPSFEPSTSASPSNSDSTLTLPQEPASSSPSPSNPTSPLPPISPAAPATSPISPATSQESPVSTSPTDSSDSVNYCPACGQKTRPGANYCAQCGTLL